MATFDDAAGVWFTIESIKLYQPEVLDQIDFLIVDNNPLGEAGPSLRSFASRTPNCSYVPFNAYQGTSVKDIVFKEAEQEIVCCIDSHVLLAPGSLQAILDWFTENSNSLDLLQGPLLSEIPGIGTTHFDPEWGSGLFGRWAQEPRSIDTACAPFEIKIQGLGLFACRRDAWPGLNFRLRGFSGDEGYIHEKFRRRGGRVLCHPKLGWRHYCRTSDAPYENSWFDRVRNYCIAWSEIGWDLNAIYAHFSEYLGPVGEVKEMFDSALSEIRHPLHHFDGIFCIPRDVRKCSPYGHLQEIERRVEHIPNDDLPENEEFSRLLRFRSAVAISSRRGYEHMLLLLNNSQPEVTALNGIRITDFAAVNWGTRCFFESSYKNSSPLLAIAIQKAKYDEFLDRLPTTADEQKRFLATWGSVDSYISHLHAVQQGEIFGPLEINSKSTSLARGVVASIAAASVFSVAACQNLSGESKPSDHQTQKTFERGGDPLPSAIPPASSKSKRNHGIRPPTTTFPTPLPPTMP